MLKQDKSQLFINLLIILALNTAPVSVNASSIPANVHSVVRYSKGSQYDKSTIFLQSFFKWYKTKFNYLDHHIYFVDMDLKNNTPYRINFAKTEEYLSILKSSGFFSESYIMNARSYFKKIDLTLQKTKQNDGTVDGLDYDLILHSQEPEAILENLSGIHLEIINTSKDRVIVKMKTKFNQDTYSLYYLTKEGDKYQIDKIDYFISGKLAN